ncbi:MAG: T9SS type A sorting domain-containing protein, partial [Candidatus Marinimicrobia bacterium]|nr:T9SS type A sorting domain-containing protein [Candidatus Neomarinimicrobiota bacterium]
FSIPIDGYIDFTIYDLNGRAVSNVKETSFYQRGSHTISYQADHLSSGIYFYSIKNDRHTQFRKMIVLK